MSTTAAVPVGTHLPVFTPSASIGGVERVGREIQVALSGQSLHEGLSAILRSPRPSGRWTALTWKTHAVVAARHPGVAQRGSIWLHGAELTRDRGRALSWLRSRTLQDAALLLAVSPHAVQLLPPDLRDAVQLIGPPVPAPSGPQRAHTASGCARLLSIGRAVPRKGHDLALRAAEVLSRSVPVRIDVVGPGPDLPRLAGLASSLSNPRLQAVVHGGLPQPDVDRLYADADALLFLPRSEQGEFEGLGLVLLEAATHGCPAVVLDCGGSRYGVADGRSGQVLSATAGPEQVAAAAAGLVADPQARLAAQAFALAFSLPDWQSRVRAVAAGDRPDWRWPSLV